jgi:hypothetical protein
MLYSLRSIALLMLLAGASMGVFAGTLMANRQVEAKGPTLERRVEERVRLYRDMYALDETRTDAVRQVLLAHEREVREMLLELSRRHKDEFTAQNQKTTERLQLIFKQD